MGDFLTVPGVRGALVVPSRRVPGCPAEGGEAYASECGFGPCLLFETPGHLRRRCGGFYPLCGTRRPHNGA